MSIQDTYILINRALVVGPGHSIKLPVVTDDHTVECYYIDADDSVTVVVLDLETSFDPPEINDDAARWYCMQRHTFLADEIIAKRAMFVKLGVPGRRIRVNLITITGADGSSDFFSVRYSPLYKGRS